ncbi:MAG: secretin N-terminal domain-containing protein, partial [Candidatus Poribacteria bacterium]
STASVNIPILQDLIDKLDISIPDLETDTKIFPLVNSDAESVAEILNNVYAQGNQRRGGGGFDFFFWMPRQARGTSQRSGVLTGSISIEAYTRTNSLIVTTSSARNFEIIQKLIEQLDQPTPPDYRYSTFIYPLEYANAEDLQSLLNDIFSEEGGGISSRGRSGQMNFFRMMMTGRSPVPRDTATLFGQVRVNADPNTNSLIVTTPERNHEAVKDVIRQLDVSRGQVWMEIKVLEVSLGEESNLGLEWTWKEGKHLGKDGLNAIFGTDFNVSDSSMGFTYKVFNKNLTATLNALMKENKVEVLSAPSILTRDNQRTTLSRGKDIPYLQSTQTNQFGQIIYDYDFLQDIGINLSITPHIAKYGTKSKMLKEGEKRTIGLEIERINVSSFLEYTDFNAPVTSDSTITSYIDVEDGEQIAIGGMIKKETKKTIHKFPILGSIPFLGRLFNRTADSIENTQLWILITPHIIDISKPEDKETLKKLQEEQRQQVEMKMESEINKTTHQNNQSK